MNERDEIRRFNQDIDAQLAHDSLVTSPGVEPGYRELIEMTQLLESTDFSQESKIHQSLRKRLLASLKQNPSLTPINHPHANVHVSSLLWSLGLLTLGAVIVLFFVLAGGEGGHYGTILLSTPDQTAAATPISTPQLVTYNGLYYQQIVLARNDIAAGSVIGTDMLDTIWLATAVSHEGIVLGKEEVVGTTALVDIPAGFPLLFYHIYPNELGDAPVTIELPVDLILSSGETRLQVGQDVDVLLTLNLGWQPTSVMYLDADSIRMWPATRWYRGSGDVVLLPHLLETPPEGIIQVWDLTEGVARERRWLTTHNMVQQAEVISTNLATDSQTGVSLLSSHAAELSEVISSIFTDPALLAQLPASETDITVTVRVLPQEAQLLQWAIEVDLPITLVVHLASD